MKKISVPTVVIVIIILVVRATAPALTPALLPSGAPASAPLFGPIVAAILLLSAGGDNPQPCFQEEGGCAMPTPQSRIAIVIDDEERWRSIIVEELQKVGYTVHSCPTFCDYPGATVIVVDAQDPSRAVVGPGYVKTLRLSHPQAFIVGLSAALELIQPGASVSIRAQFTLAGTNLNLDKNDFDNREFRALLPT